MYRFIFLFFVFNPPIIFSQQPCQCTDYAQLKKSAEPDSLIAQKLLKNSSLLCRAKGLEMMANQFTEEMKLDSAESLLRKAEQQYKDVSCSDSILLNTYKIWAQLNYSRADFAQAQVYTLKMLACAESAGKTYELAKSYTMVAQLFNQTNQAETGIVYTQKAAKLLPKLREDEQYSIIAFLSKRYLWHYQDTKTQSSLDSSQLYSREYLARARRKKDAVAMGIAFNSLQGVAYERGEFQEAIRLLDSSFQYTPRNDYETLRLYYSDKADLLVELKNFKQAQQLADSALHYAMRSYNPAYVAEVYDLQETIARSSGDFKRAYELFKLKSAITDSIRTVEKTAVVAELEKKYNQAKNEGLIQDLDKKRQFFMLLALAGLFASLSIGFFLRQQKLKHKQDILETEQRLNRARMNPHFFFNALASLQQYALRDNNGLALASNLSKFSNIMRETLESTYKEYNSIEQEMDFLNEYLEVQKIRFPQTFSYSIAAEPDLEIDEILIPSMILQPFVENCIEHGFSGIDYPGHVDIRFSLAEKEIQIEISDNGKGFTTTYKENNEHISRASQIIKDRIFLLNIKLKTKAGFSIDNNKDGSGALVKIHLPLLFKGAGNK